MSKKTCSVEKLRRATRVASGYLLVGDRFNVTYLIRYLRVGACLLLARAIGLVDKQGMYSDYQA